MNNSFVRLIDGMCATLRSEVLPRLDDEFARGQVFGVINLLNTFKVRADWAPGFLVQQIAAQHRALMEVGQALSDVEDAPRIEPRQDPPLVTAAQLLAQRDANNLQVGQLLEWLAEHRLTLPQQALEQSEGALRSAMRAEIEIELKHSPRPLFAEMSSGREDDETAV
jgi:hypothetical protein